MQSRETQITMVKWTNAGGQTKRANERSFVYRPPAWRRWRNVKTTYWRENVKTVVIQRVLARNVRSFIILPSGEGFTKLIFFNKNNRANFLVQKKSIIERYGLCIFWEYACLSRNLQVPLIRSGRRVLPLTSAYFNTLSLLKKMICSRWESNRASSTI